VTVKSDHLQKRIRSKKLTAETLGFRYHGGTRVSVLNQASRVRSITDSQWRLRYQDARTYLIISIKNLKHQRTKQKELTKLGTWLGNPKKERSEGKHKTCVSTTRVAVLTQEMQSKHLGNGDIYFFS